MGRNMLMADKGRCLAPAGRTPCKCALVCAGGGAEVSDIHGVKTGAQYPSDTTTAGTTTGSTGTSTVPATAGYSGVFLACWSTAMM